MKRTITILILAAAWSLLSCPVAGLADPTGIPDVTLSTATVPSPGPFSVYTRPDGGGHPLSAAYLMDGQSLSSTLGLAKQERMLPSTAAARTRTITSR